MLNTRHDDMIYSYSRSRCASAICVGFLGRNSISKNISSGTPVTFTPARPIVPPGDQIKAAMYQVTSNLLDNMEGLDLYSAIGLIKVGNVNPKRSTANPKQPIVNPNIIRQKVGRRSSSGTRTGTLNSVSKKSVGEIGIGRSVKSLFIFPTGAHHQPPVHAATRSSGPGVDCGHPAARPSH